MRLALLLLLSLTVAAGAAKPPHHGKPQGKAQKATPKPKPKYAAPPKSRPATGDPEVIFTFDDGPAADRTRRVLDVLDAHRVKAIFFVNGMRFEGDSPSAEKGRAMLRETVRRGHAIGNHTVHHFFLCGKKGAQVAEEEVVHNADLIRRATGLPPEFFRTPFGSRCPTLTKTLDRLAIKPVYWDIDPQDWKVQNTNAVRDRVIAHLRRLKGRAILLLHDIHECTVRAVPQILDWIAKENAARKERGEPQIKIADYSVLLPPRPLIPPLIDNLGRILVEVFVPADGPLAKLRRWIDAGWPVQG